MKITIAPSEDQSTEEFPYYTVTVENGKDGCTIIHALAMFHQAMIGWGFGSQETVKHMNEFTP